MEYPAFAQRENVLQRYPRGARSGIGIGIMVLIVTGITSIIVLHRSDKE